jgi:hypothetical protein
MTIDRRSNITCKEAIDPIFILYIFILKIETVLIILYLNRQALKSVFLSLT